MRVLVTGATGFIGGKLVDALKQDGNPVRVLVRRGREGRFISPNGVEPVWGDLEDSDSLLDACRGVDAVVHAAGALGKWGIPERELDRINVGGVLHLMDAARRAGVGQFVHLSAGGVSGPMGPVPADETIRCHPKTPYERTKLRGEEAALEFHRKWNFPLTILRPTFTYGPGDRHKLPIFRAVQSGKIVLIGDGNSLIHPVFVDDAVRGIRSALATEGRGEVFLIGGPRAVTKRELLDTIAESLGLRRKWLRIPRGLAFAAAVGAEAVGRLLRKPPPLTRGRVLMMGWSFGYKIDKAQERLGYLPIVDLRQGIGRTAAWYRDQGMIE